MSNQNNQQGQENQDYSNQTQDTNQQNYAQAQYYAQQQQQAYFQQQQQQYQLQQTQMQNVNPNQNTQVPQGNQNNQQNQYMPNNMPGQIPPPYSQNLPFQNTYQPIMPNYPIQPFQFPSFPLPNTNNDKIKQLNTQIKDKEAQIETLENDIDQVRKEKTKEIKQLQKQNADLKIKVDSLEDDEARKDEEITRHKNDITLAQQRIKQLEQLCKNQQEQLIEQSGEIDSLNLYITTLKQQHSQVNPKQSDYEQSMQQYYNQQQAQLQEAKQKTNKQLNEQKKMFDDEVKEKDEKINQFQTRIKELEYEINKEHQNFMNSRDEIANWQKKYTMLNKQLSEKDQSIDNLSNQLSSLKFQNNQLNEKLKADEGIIAELQKQKEQVETFYKQYLAEVGQNKVTNQNKKKFEEDLQKLQNGMQQAILKKEQDLQQGQKQKELEFQENKKRKVLQDQKILENKQYENKMIKELMMKKTQGSLEEFGKLDICYVIDCTLSMDPYIEQARSCVQESLKVIKQQTNRDTIVSSIAYYDIEQKPQNGKYFQFDFSNNIQNFQKFILDVKIVGGRDVPEDVRGALEQMVSNLKWKNKFKIAILITDSPCHGKKYHTIVSDFHPNDEITPILHKLIEQQIILIGFNLNDKTIKMYDEFKKIYEAKNASDLFIYVDVTGLNVNQLAEKMASSLGSASVTATQVKSSGTKTKKQQQERPKNKDGAIEALCKQGDFQNFENQAKVVDTKFTVLNVTINDQVFSDNILTINNIGKNPQKDYLIKVEGIWNCIRTESPFAFGMMKDVFLMKKKNGGSDELYVIKTPLGSKPYQSQHDAIQECRSHLICQQLMKKFKQDIQEALESQNINNRAFPNVVYSDFLILEESKDKYWIAERFFKGEFVKYNNNFGFINEDISELNKFAQAFSYYTFFISKGQYMINDVQGVGTYFTDPAVNTTTGDFDDTDLGQEGQDMFLVNFQSKKQLPFEILNLLNQLTEDQEK